MASTQKRRGRLPAREVAARREEILDAAMAELAEHGFGGVTMLGIANRAGASKETLYSWFGNRDGLFSALIQAQSAATIAAVDRALDTAGDVPTVLRNIAAGLLTLLTGPRSVALNRAAMTSPELASLLLQHGRNTTGPRIIAWFGQFEIVDREGIPVPPWEAFEVLYGLAMRDRQIRTLLGTPPPTPPEIDTEAERAARRHQQLFTMHRQEQNGAGAECSSKPDDLLP